VTEEDTGCRRHVFNTTGGQQMTDPEQTKQTDDKDLQVEEVADLEADPSDVDDVKGGPIGCRGAVKVGQAPSTM
jgi:hypothetical protein